MNNDSQQDPLLTKHEYDGIRELDNPLPSWWLGTFFVTIIFSFLYFIHLHLTPDNLIEDEYAAAVKAQAELQTSNPVAAPDEKALAAAANSPHEVAEGKAHFQALCVACHGANGQGGIGPNLTDRFWLHGQGQLSDLAKIIGGGVLEKGMPAWGQVLKADEVIEVAAFVRTLQGTNPAGAKAPQGTEIK
jgi:cytochrome c oxidase cbb3-type subunit 3